MSFSFIDNAKLLDYLNQYMMTVGKNATSNQLEMMINAHAKAIKTKTYNYDVQVVKGDNGYTYYPINSPDFLALVKYISTETKLEYGLCIAYVVAVRGMTKTGEINGSFLTPITTEQQQQQTDDKIKFYAVSAIAILGLIFLLKK